MLVFLELSTIVVSGVLCLLMLGCKPRNRDSSLSGTASSKTWGKSVENALGFYTADLKLGSSTVDETEVIFFKIKDKYSMRLLETDIEYQVEDDEFLRGRRPFSIAGHDKDDAVKPCGESPFAIDKPGEAGPDGARFEIMKIDSVTYINKSTGKLCYIGGYYEIGKSGRVPFSISNFKKYVPKESGHVCMASCQPIKKIFTDDNTQYEQYWRWTTVTKCAKKVKDIKCGIEEAGSICWDSFDHKKLPSPPKGIFGACTI